MLIDSPLAEERHCRACGARLLDGRTCDTCGAVHCSRRGCGVVLDADAKPARCPNCQTFTPWNRSHESHGLSGRHAKAERAKAVPALVDAILAERSLTRETASRTVVALCSQMAQAQLLRESGYEAAAVNGPKTTGGAAGLKTFTQAVDREQRAIHLLQTLAPLPVAGAAQEVTAIEWVVVDADGTELSTRRSEQAGVTEHNTLSITRVIVDAPDAATFASETARRALHPEHFTPMPVIPAREPVAVEVLEAEVIEPTPAPARPARLSKQEHAALLERQTRRMS